MSMNKAKEHFMARPIERHTTAAWADIAEIKPVSNVTIPCGFKVRNAKEHVDTNEK